jgi:hypothetical protein
MQIYVTEYRVMDSQALFMITRNIWFTHQFTASRTKCFLLPSIKMARRTRAPPARRVPQVRWRRSTHDNCGTHRPGRAEEIIFGFEQINIAGLKQDLVF